MSTYSRRCQNYAKWYQSYYCLHKEFDMISFWAQHCTTLPPNDTKPAYSLYTQQKKLMVHIHQVGTNNLLVMRRISPRLINMHIPPKLVVSNFTSWPSWRHDSPTMDAGTLPSWPSWRRDSPTMDAGTVCILTNLETWLSNFGCRSDSQCAHRANKIT